ncbi:MAG: hypothetical protein NTU61_06565 [Candidatus Altiarchaeota archaeon]|nr:hypothetical protein [Candidatus Altiarchaeota archaeon]
MKKPERADELKARSPKPKVRKVPAGTDEHLSSDDKFAREKMDEQESRQARRRRVEDNEDERNVVPKRL